MEWEQAGKTKTKTTEVCFQHALLEMSSDLSKTLFSPHPKKTSIKLSQRGSAGLKGVVYEKGIYKL